MKLWQKDFELDKWIETFTIGKDKEYDLRIAPYDVVASKAHARMLQTIGILTEEELSDLLKGLDKIAQRIQDGDYVIEAGIEDIHSQIELDLTRALGDTGKKIHAGRSRNDQVLVALKLLYRDELKSIQNLLAECIDALLQKADLHKGELMPGYTHSQIGMVSSFGLWFSCYAEALVDDHNFLVNTSRIIDQNPLGSSAGYGNSFPLDRELTTELMDFNGLNVNSMYAQMTRGKSEFWMGQILSSIALSIVRFASDVCLFTSANYRFIKLPDDITTGSSIMPHKKNPDVFELIRAKCNQLLTTPQQVAMITSNLMSGYHRDLQSIKEIIFPAIEMTKDILFMLTYCIPKMEVTPNLLDNPDYDYLFSVDDVNKLVLAGMSFRDAYKKVSKDIEEGNYRPDKNIRHTHVGSFGNLRVDMIRGKMEK
jgi:argininosuccinate lyase